MQNHPLSVFHASVRPECFPGIDLSTFQKKDRNEKISEDILENNSSWVFKSNLKDVFNDAHAVIILTEWKEYSNLDWLAISKQILNTAWIFDTRGVLNEVDCEKLNTNIWKIGNI